MILPRYAFYAAMLACAGLPIYVHAPKFYADTYGIGLGTIGVALFFLRLGDVIADPFLGYLAGKLAARRAWAAMIAAVGLALGMVGLFTNPAPISPLLWMGISLTLLLFSYSFLNILYYARGIAQSQSMGADGHIRLASWREAGALAGITLATVGPLVLTSAGFSDPYTFFALGIAAFILIASSLMHGLWAGPAFPATTGFAGLLHDRSIRKLLLVAFLNAAPVAVTATLFLFFVEYRLEQPEWAGLYLLGKNPNS